MVQVLHDENDIAGVRPLSDTHDHVARAVIVNEQGHILLVRRAPDDSFPGRWEFAGGGTDHEKHVLALTWELDEELGLQLLEVRECISVEPFYVSETSTFDECIYMVRVIGEMVLSHEHDAYLWVDIDEEVPDYMSRTTSDAIEHLRDNRHLLEHCSIVTC